MNNRFAMRLAARNLGKNRTFYRPYLLTVMGVTAGFYMMASTTHVESVAGLSEFGTLEYILNLGLLVVGLVSALFLLYTNSFLMKQRSREFALYSILGMTKGNIARVLFCETVCTAALGIGGGLVLGFVFDRLLLLLLCRLLGVAYDGPLVYWDCAGRSAVLFAALLLLTLVINTGRVGLSQPVALLYAKNTGEREPKARWLMALLGLAALGAGYYIAVTIRSPLMALSLFFVAALLVIAGTFLLFLAGSVTLLKLLRKNKRYYYRARHFVSVSSLMYRMKRNAAGLAVVCILSTAVLVMLSSTVTLYAGIRDLVDGQYPRQVMTIAADREEPVTTSQDLLQSAEEAGFHPQNVMAYRTLVTSGLRTEEGFTSDQTIQASSWDIQNGVAIIILLPVSDYETLTGDAAGLSPGEMLARSQYVPLPETLTVFGRPMAIVGEAKQTEAARALESDYAAVNSVVFVVTEEDFTALYELQKEDYGDHASEIYHHANFDLPKGEDADLCARAMHDAIVVRGHSTASIDTATAVERSTHQLFGGLLWLGLFLGALFLAGTVLIIYYKQVSEGYEDRERFDILQKVGMSRAEVAGAIRSQVLLVFFLPLGTAALHMAAATPMILRLLRAFQFTNTGMFVGCVGVCVAVFAALYTLVYAITARTYYKIVAP